MLSINTLFVLEPLCLRGPTFITLCTEYYVCIIIIIIIIIIIFLLSFTTHLRVFSLLNLEVSGLHTDTHHSR